MLEDKRLVDIEPWEGRFRASGFVGFVMLSMYIVFSPIGLAQEGGMNMMTLVAVVALAAVCAVLSLALEKKYK